MRVTTSQAHRSQLDYIQNNLQRLLKAQDQASTGLRFTKASEDPSAAADVLRADATLASFTQFGRNGEVAIARASEEDRVLNGLQLLAERAGELASQQAGSNSDASTRLIAKAEVDQIIQSAIGLGNTRFNSGYLFGGSRATEQPMANTPSSVPPYTTNAAAITNPQVEITAGQLSAPNHNAHEIFNNTNVMQALKDLSTALGNNDVVGITAAMPALTSASDNVGQLLGETGAKVNQYETIKSQMLSATLDTRTRRSLLIDIDLTDAAANFAQAQTSYQAALSAANKVLNLNVLDYLR
jgi:flagellar hook-associated protein 3 FlgL